MSKKDPKVCVVGVGAVGVELLRLLRQRQFPMSGLTVLARSARTIEVDGKPYDVQQVAPQAFAGQELVLFAGTEGEKGASVTYAPEAIRQGALCIDNGADFRMDPKVPLVVPEINPEDLKTHHNLIANPNCSTIQMVLALAPLHRAAGLKRVVVSTYQAASGAGRRAIENLKAQSADCLKSGKAVRGKTPAEQTAFNVVPQIGSFQEMGYTSEEWKMVRETRKILHMPQLKINATTVRVPVINGHSESIYVELDRPMTPEAAKKLLSQQSGIQVTEADDDYPMPVDADAKDPVFVGRIRQDPDDAHGLAFWAVSDNLRKGAALNAIQIAEALLKNR